jgi:Ulp1 family protease
MRTMIKQKKLKNTAAHCTKPIKIFSSHWIIDIITVTVIHMLFFDS